MATLNKETVKQKMSIIDKFAKKDVEKINIFTYHGNIKTYSLLGDLLRSPFLSKEELEKVKKCYKVYSRSFNKFLNSQLVKSEKHIAVLKYLLWNYHMPDVKKIDVLKYAVKKGIVKRAVDAKGNDQLFISGLKVKVLSEDASKNKSGSKIKKYHFPEELTAVKISFTNSEEEAVKKIINKGKNIEFLGLEFSEVTTENINPVRLSEKTKKIILDNFKSK